MGLLASTTRNIRAPSSSSSNQEEGRGREDSWDLMDLSAFRFLQVPISQERRQHVKSFIENLFP